MESNETNSFNSDETAVAEIDAPDHIRVSVTLPTSGSLSFIVHVNATVQDIRQLLFESKECLFITCFFFEKPGSNERITNEMMPLSSFLPSEKADNKAELSLHLVIKVDKFTEREVDLHVGRFREFLSGFKTQQLNLGYGFAETRLYELEHSSGNPFNSYSFDAPSNSLANLTPNSTPLPASPLNSLSLSKHNPPPYYRKIRGDILYLSAVTLEGSSLEITCSSNGFYTNRSNDHKFDPTRKGKAYDSIIDLFKAESKQFNTKFDRILTFFNKKQPEEYLSTATGAYTWTVPESALAQPPAATAVLDDYLRIEDDIRDWNEEWTSFKEVICKSPLERIQKEMTVVKMYSDFCESAKKGIMAVLGGLPPLNTPASPEENPDEVANEGRIWSYKNIFFSEVVGAGEGLDVRGGKNAAWVCAGKDLKGVEFLSNLNENMQEVMKDPSSTEEKTSAKPSEGIHTIATCVIEYCGHRFIAQSIIPGILKRDTEKVCYGSVDFGKKISADKDFHEKIRGFSRMLRLEEHTVVDTPSVSDEKGKAKADETEEKKLWSSLECKGIKGDDGRHYLLDLYRMTPTDILFLEKLKNEREEKKKSEEEYVEYPHTVCLMRYELIELYLQQQIKIMVSSVRDETEKEYQELMKVYDKDSETPEPNQAAMLEEGLNAAMDKFDIRFNMDAFANYALESKNAQSGAEKPEESESEKKVRELSSFLLNSVIPSFVISVLDSPTTVPLTGEQLTKHMHQMGINMRYLGKVLEVLESVESSAAEKDGKKDELPKGGLEYTKQLVLQELVSRGTKWVLRDLVEGKPVDEVIVEITDTLNALLGNVTEGVRSTQAIREEVAKEVKSRFRYSMSAETVGVVAKKRAVPMLRSICKAFGIQIVERNYDFTADKIFLESDIVNIVPVVKEIKLKSQFAEEVWEQAHHSLMQNQRPLALELFSESITIYEQVYGPIHPECSRVIGQYAMILYQGNDLEKAKNFQRKAVVVAERAYGLDDGDTLQQYMNLAYFEFMDGNTELGLRYMHHAIKYWELLSGDAVHPETSSADLNIGTMLQKVSSPLASKFLDRSVAINTRFLGSENMSTLISKETLARSFLSNGEFKKALMIEKGVYAGYKKKFGDADQRTVEAGAMLTVLTERAVQSAKKEKEILDKTMKKANNKKNKPSMEKLENENIASKGHLPIDELVKFIEKKGAAKAEGGKKRK
ncbi:Intracellular distribution of mitochondria [Nowakowskiella sp. JEL0407]|nr:Intracellular distribution of mitochondria [Nowakowskiella sp. JEL0407]